VIEAAKQLKVIGRAGVGVDNIDCESATKNGVIVIK
jgi:D-3-phosphoglycerate dehydrogenase